MGSAISTPTDGKGVFIYRDANGIGNVSFTGAQLQWNYGVDGIADNDSVEIKVCAIEMAYIPEGAFYAGTGGGEFNSFYKYDSVTPTNINTPYLVANAGDIAVGANNGRLNYSTAYIGGSWGYPSTGDGAGPIPSTFPTGYESFWVMKYECSRQQYADFLNMLDATRAANRKTAGSPITGTFPTYVAPSPEIAITRITAADLFAYADWAGMRPMTELEYEKACRGANNLPIPNEYAWGNTTLNITATLLHADSNNEVSAIANANYFVGGSPRRCGIFATASSDRIASGGTYYGVMDMTGNASEQTISVGTAANRLVSKNIHGDGSINAVGNSDQPNWTGVTIIERGGSYFSSQIFSVNYQTLKTSVRFVSPDVSTGIRLVRTAN
jgi:formylglycine-generating enzyme required for sulfatase activity